MLVKAKVFPSSKKEGVVKKKEDSFEIKVKAKPQRGEANREVMKSLSSYFKIPESKIKLIKGATRRSKIFEIKNKFN